MAINEPSEVAEVEKQKLAVLVREKDLTHKPSVRLNNVGGFTIDYSYRDLEAGMTPESVAAQVEDDQNVVSLNFGERVIGAKTTEVQVGDKLVEAKVDVDYFLPQGGTFFIAGPEVRTYTKKEAANLGGDNTLVLNMENLKIDTMIRARNGNFLPFDKTRDKIITPSSRT